MDDDAVPEESGWRVATREEAADHREPPVAAEITIRLYSLEPGDAQVTIGLGDAIAPEGEATALVWDGVGRRAAAELAEAVRLLRPGGRVEGPGRRGPGLPLPTEIAVRPTPRPG